MSSLARRAALVAIPWLVLALLFTPQTYLINQRGAVSFSWLQAFGANAGLFGLWAVLTPAVLWLASRLPIERGVLVRHLTLHTVAAFVTALVHILVLGQLNEVLMRLVGVSDDYRPPVPIGALLVGYGATNVMIYWGVVAIGQALAYFRRYQDRELRLTQAELHALRTQLQPHFLFNALNAIAELVHVDAARADAAITKLSDLLRLALSRGHSHELPLKEELDFVRTYLEIQQMLLQERLDVARAGHGAPAAGRERRAARHRAARRRRHAADLGAAAGAAPAPEGRRQRRRHVRPNRRGRRRHRPVEHPRAAPPSVCLRRIARSRAPRSRPLEPDLVFLDVQMPEVGGFDVLEAVGVERVPAVVL